MFNPDFFPTPDEVIDQMLAGYDLKNKVILEPSAGKGNIVEYLQANGAKEVLACENHPDLSKILATKCRIIEPDFLKLTSDKVSHIDMIVMNPPFSADETHILHAWEVAPQGCEIIALCNWQTIENPFSSKRKELAAILTEYGKVENLGDCFRDAERKTSVDIGLIIIKKPGESYSNEFQGFFLEEEEEPQGNGIMSYNVVRDLVNRYVAAVKLYDKQLELGVQMNQLTQGFYASSFGINITESGKPKAREEFKKDLQREGWKFIFDKMDMGKFITRGVRHDINKFVEEQTHIPFTMRNIYHMLDIIWQTREQSMDRSLIEVFERVTKHYDENRYNLPGWKTNSHYLLNEKVIIPNMAPQGKWSTGLRIETVYGTYFDLMEDLCKALCFVTGTDYDTIGSLGNRIRNEDYYLTPEGKKVYSHLNYHQSYNKQKQEIPLYGDLFEWGFFEVRAYKKGTMHFKFKDHEAWATFNQRIAKIKGFPLHESTKQTRDKTEKKQQSETPKQPKKKPVILGTFKVPQAS